jgi:hypothetical protein
MRGSAQLFVICLFAASLCFAKASDDATEPRWLQKDYLAHHAEMMHKVRTLTIPEVDWEKVGFRQALEDLAFKCQRADPTHQGIHFIVERSWKNAFHPHLTLHGKDQPVIDILRQLGEFRITDGDVCFFDDGGEGFMVSTFCVPQGYLGLHAPMLVTDGHDTLDMRTVDARDQLAAKGVPFPAGGTAVYLTKQSKLIVRGGYETIEGVDELLNP